MEMIHLRGRGVLGKFTLCEGWGVGRKRGRWRITHNSEGGIRADVEDARAQLWFEFAVYGTYFQFLSLQGLWGRD